MDNTATMSQISTIRRRAYDATAREMSAEGVHLTHEQADDLGDEGMDWVRRVLGLNVRTTDQGAICTPPVHYVGRDEDGDLVTAEDVEASYASERE